MKNAFGNAVSVTLFGESHGPFVGAVLDGLAAGLPVDEDFIRHQLARRRPQSNGSTERREKDAFSVISGVYQGKTTGSPLCIVIPNEDARPEEYQTDCIRPGHADYTAQIKYAGYQDPRGGGHFSGRLTVALVAAGSILLQALERKNIHIVTHVASSKNVKDNNFTDILTDKKAISRMETALGIPVISEKVGEALLSAVGQAKNDGDSIGGVLQTAVVGCPAGIGEPWFDSVESILSHALFSIPAVKGVSFGSGFDFADMNGSEANDSLCLENGDIRTETNHNGGINGGISNGMPLVFQCVIKPTPSIAKPQKTVNIASHKEVTFSCMGRHDAAVFPRAAAVVDCVTALCLSDLLTQRYGTDWLRE